MLAQGEGDETVDWVNILERLPEPKLEVKLNTTCGLALELQLFRLHATMHLSVITLVSTILLISTSLLAHQPLHPNENHNYQQYHSYPDDTSLDERDGWKRVSVSDLPYKYSNDTSYSTDVSQISTYDVLPRTLNKHVSKHHFRTRGHSHKTKAKNKTKIVKGGSKDFVKGTGIGGVLDVALKGVGKATEVVITWSVMNRTPINHV